MRSLAEIGKELRRNKIPRGVLENKTFIDLNHCYETYSCPKCRSVLAKVIYHEKCVCEIFPEDNPARYVDVYVLRCLNCGMVYYVLKDQGTHIENEWSAEID